LKFTINSIKARQSSFSLIGYGGLPSNHSAIVSSMAALIAFKEGIGHPAFGVAVTVAFIVMLDANSLRRQVGNHAAAINKLSVGTLAYPSLRERIGHARLEIAAGVAVGIVVAAAVNILLP
jgi:acid phosphatase family membrane protein YuiD